MFVPYDESMRYRPGYNRIGKSRQAQIASG